MKVKDVAKANGFDEYGFEEFVRDHPSIKYTRGFVDNTIADADVERAITLYKEKLEFDKQKKTEAEIRKKEEALRKIEAAARAKEKDKELASMLITSGFNFDGYTITKYSGYISGDDATQIPRSGVFGGNNGQNLTDALVRIRRQAIRELKEAAYDLGCNAVIGVDFDYITLEPETANLTGGTLYEPYIICVTANGNAVVIERNEDLLSSSKIDREKQEKESFELIRDTILTNDFPNDANPTDPVKPIAIEHMFICPNCGQEQANNRAVCFKCGAKFENV